MICRMKNNHKRLKRNISQSFKYLKRIHTFRFGSLLLLLLFYLLLFWWWCGGGGGGGGGGWEGDDGQIEREINYKDG